MSLDDAAAVVGEARGRFEANAAALTALQMYVTGVLAPPDE